MRKLDKELISTALQSLLADGLSYADIHAETGVNNLGRLVTGKYGITVDTWLKLHEAYPGRIPAPQYETGEPVIRSGAKKTATVAHWEAPTATAAKIRRFYKLFHRHQSEAVIDGLITYLEAVDAATKRGPKV